MRVDQPARCAHGVDLGRGCPGCSLEVEQAVREFYRRVAAGQYDREGYTPTERRARDKKLLAGGKLPLGPGIGG